MADSLAGLDSAQPLSRGFSLEWKLTDKVGLVWPVGGDPVVIETAPKLEGSLSLATDTTGLGLISTMRSGLTKWFRIKAEGDTIQDTYRYTIKIDFPAQISEVGEFSDEDGIYLIEYTLAGIHDSSWNKAFQIEVITNLQTL
jgi:hypothetical protein